MILRPLFNIITKKDSFCKLQRLLISTKTFYKYFVYYANATSVTVSIQAVARLSYLKFSLPYAPKTPPFFRVAGDRDRHRVRQYAPRHVRAGVRHLLRLDDHGERYGADHIFAAGLACAVVVRQDKIYRVRLCHAERRRQSRQNADAVRQSSKLVPVFVFRDRRRRIFRDNGDPVRGRVRADRMHLSCRQTRADTPRDPARTRAARVENGRLFRAVRAVGDDRIPSVSVLCRTDRRHRRAGGARTEVLFARRLRLAADLLRILCLFGQSLAHPKGHVPCIANQVTPSKNIICNSARACEFKTF